jgi:hypothetical protein
MLIDLDQTPDRPRLQQPDRRATAPLPPQLTASETEDKIYRNSPLMTVKTKRPSYLRNPSASQEKELSQRNLNKS